jgi:hypothetical protein
MLDDTDSTVSFDVYPDDPGVIPELVDADAAPAAVDADVDADVDAPDDDEVDDDDDCEYIFDHGRFIIKSSNVSQSYFNETKIARTDPTEHEYIVLILFIFHFFSRCK